MNILFTGLKVCVVCNLALAETYHVPEDFPTIQYAIDAASDGDEIIVAPGTYTSTADEVVDMRGKEIWLHSSGGAEVTIIEGESKRRGILCENYETSSTIIEGFKINNCYSSSGGGTQNYNCNPSYIDCIFINNSGAYGGAINNQNCSSVFLNCDFLNNSSGQGGACNLSNSSSTFQNCTFESNSCTQDGGGVFASSGNPLQFVDCVFRSNIALRGGGTFSYSGNIFLTGCVFENNIASDDGYGNGGAVYCQSSSHPVITTCSFTNNIALRGGAISCFDATIIDCGFIQNNAKNGGGIYSYGSNDSNSPTISNSNFCENVPDAIYGNWNNKGGNDFLNTCGDVEGACCVKKTCYEVEIIFCNSIGGDWLGYNATCEVDSCTDPPQYGACCINGESIPLFDYDCDRILGTFMGEGTNPDDVTCPVHCAEDVTGDGVVDVSDLLAIIAVWGACP